MADSDRPVAGLHLLARALEARAAAAGSARELKRCLARGQQLLVPREVSVGLGLRSLRRG